MTYAQRYQEQGRTERIAMARERLGGVCVVCGTVEGLQFDHIDPATKIGNVSMITNWSLVRFIAEVDKCQLLCQPHHSDKTGRAEHGTASGYNSGCKCIPCAEAKRAANREGLRRYRERKRLSSTG